MSRKNRNARHQSTRPLNVRGIQMSMPRISPEPQKKLHMFELSAYAGGLLNSFMKWEEDGKRESAHSVAETIYHLFSRHEERI